MIEDLQDEVWKDIKGFESLYQVSNMGRVKSLLLTRRTKKKSFILKPSLSRGYCRVNLGCAESKGVRFVHRLVAEAFLDNDENFPFVNHKDSDPLNNKLSNLEWCSPEHNSNHARVKGRMGKKINPNLAREIFTKYHSNSVSMSDLRDFYDVHFDVVSGICHRKMWPEATEEIKRLADKDLFYYKSEAVKTSQFGQNLNYTISDEGDAWKNGIPLKAFPNQHGYKALRVDGKERLMHRIVAELFISNPYGLRVVHHMDGDKWNANARNLVWCSQSHNLLEAHKSGAAKAIKGEENKASRLTGNEVLEIRKRFSEGESQKSLAKEFKVGNTTVHSLVHRKSWTQI